MTTVEYETLEREFLLIAAAPAGEQERLLRDLAVREPDTARYIGAMIAAEATAPDWLDDGAAGESAAAAPAREDGSLPRIDGFRLLGEIGRGGMGVVYEAEQERPRRRIAIKLVREGRSAAVETIRRFEREADALGRLQHPAIAAVYLAGRTLEGEPYLAMELVEGRPLDEAAADLPLAERLRLFCRLCDAVAAAHEQGVIHLDLKPANVLVAADGRLKVVDFGLARLAPRQEATETMTVSIRGTLAYMSPQRLAGEPPASADDVYALGAILQALVKSEAAPGRGQRRPLRRAVRLAMSSEPALRPTADGLQRMVARSLPERRRQRRALVAAGAALVIGGGGWLAASTAGPDESTWGAQEGAAAPAGARGAYHAIGPGLSLRTDEAEDRLAALLLRAAELEATGRLGGAQVESAKAARILEFLGRLEEAEEMLTVLAQSPLLNPVGSAQAMIAAARVQAKLGRPAAAHAMLDAIDPELFPASEGAEHARLELGAARALALATEGRLDEAERAVAAVLEQLTDPGPEWVAYHAHRAMAEIARQRGDGQRAALHEQLSLRDTPELGPRGRRRP